jgi:hypothetical protein
MTGGYEMLDLVGRYSTEMLRSCLEASRVHAEEMKTHNTNQDMIIPLGREKTNKSQKSKSKK